MFKHLLNSTETVLLLICEFMTSSGRAANVQEQIGRVIVISAPACCAFTECLCPPAQLQL